MGETVTGMSALLSTLNAVFGTMMGNLTSLVSFIMESGHEICLIPVGVILGYTAVKLFKMVL